ncbi:MAG: hypothetical protein E6R08_03530 [Nevskiaceae bacterium]|nr:MAG: hypothetical protein E6R08_03530 [Nevskiaceae bacterium]
MSAKRQHYAEWTRVAAKALNHGATMRTAATMHWNVAGRCQRPVNRVHVGSKVVKHSFDFKRSTEISESRFIDMEVRCRRCSDCLQHRRRYWARLAEREINVSARTWLVTLTLTPDQQNKAYYAACLRLARSAIDFDGLDPEQQFAERVAEIGPEITLWLKRVRKQSGAKLRYLLVVEAHKSGLPHFHLLLHEADVEHPVRKRTIVEQWKLGFGHAKLVAQGENRRFAHYVTKYLTKSFLCRARASQKYGKSEANEGHKP